MKGSISSHAVVCGLVCASTVVFPPLACAQAPAQGNPSLLLSEAYMNFGLGFLAGVGISGLITTIGIMIYAHRREVRAAEDIEFETCVFTSARAEVPASANVSVQGPASASASANAPTSKNAPVAATSPAATTSPAAASTSASTFTSTPASAPAPSGPESCGVLSQASSSANSLRARLSQIPQVDAPIASHPDTSKASQQASQKSEQQASQKASHLTNSLEDFAEHYAQHESFKERMMTRAQGVREILSSRLSKNRYSDIPVIERADGSVGDVGEAWWSACVDEELQKTGKLAGSSVAQVPVSAPAAAASALTPAAQTSAPAAQTPMLAQPAHASATPAASAPASKKPAAYPQLSQGQRIARSIAEVDEGVYPMRREVEDLEKKDLFEEALRAMGDAMPADQAKAPIFADSIGGSSTIDEVDDIEAATAFIPFKVPPAHPEIHDTKSYIDYLVEDEFRRSKQQKHRALTHAATERYDYDAHASGPHAFESHTSEPHAPMLRVIEGGSQALPKLTTGVWSMSAAKGRNKASSDLRSHAPKHMKAESENAHISAPSPAPAASRTVSHAPKHFAFSSVKEA